MKKYSILVVVFASLLMVACAQDNAFMKSPLSFGVKAYYAETVGWHSPVINSEVKSDNNSLLNLSYAGAFVKKGITKRIVLSLGIGYACDKNFGMIVNVPMLSDTIPHLQFLGYESHYLELPVNAYFKLSEDRDNTTFAGVGIVNSFIIYTDYEKYYRTSTFSTVPPNNLHQQSISKKIKYNRMYLSATIGRAWRIADSDFSIFGAITGCFAPLIQERNTEFTLTNYKIGVEGGVSYSLCR